jgi:hypothetical protein
MFAQRIAVAAGSATLVAFVALASCSSVERTGTAGGEVVSNADAVSLVVVNNNYADVDVYAVRAGSRVRIGTVTGNSKSSFRLDPSLYPTGDLSLYAYPIGGFGSARSGRLSVARGDEVEFRIMPVIDQSTVVIRPPG